MPRKSYTIFILPHAQSRFRQIHFSKNFLIAIASIVGVAVLSAAAAPHLLLKLRAQSEALARLREENRKLAEEKRHFEASLAELGGVIGAIEDRARKIAKAVGVERLGPANPSGGAGHDRPNGQNSLQGMLDEEMQALRTRSRTLDASFDRLGEVVEARERILASTPSGLPVDGFFSEGFGWRSDPITGEREFHQGMDIVAPTGTVVRAAADGVITSAGRASGYGKVVDISHGYGYATRYGHLSRIAVKTGQRVRRGDTIGHVGSTGRSTGPHLHYEVFKAGRRVNPYRFVASRPH
jgi:murein DD-endopeptidase MepM/ murein hydrolase activator NlpD